LESHREQALLSKRLATIDCAAPCPRISRARIASLDEDKVKALCVEFEFNSIAGAFSVTLSNRTPTAQRQARQTLNHLSPF
jgi:hypothetical protein